jgi:NDP-sugar pyrophosphorylase family protein
MMPSSSQAVVLAGGKGTRLAPFTTVLPKPLLPIGNKAILEVVVEQLAAARFTDLTFAVGYLPHLIEAVFGDGSEYGVEIGYHREPSPLGTAGVLADLSHLDEPFLMMNGDVLTTLDYRALYHAHCEAGNALTVATHRRSVRSDYGVLHLDGQNASTRRVTGWEEKPEHSYCVSMGVYIVDPIVTSFVPRDEPIDLPDVVVKLLEAGQPVGSYAYDGLWLDIGRHDDYELAIDEYEKLAVAAEPLPDPVT